MPATGALIAYDLEGPRMRVGALLFLTLLPEDPERSVEVNARVVREHARGTAVDWSADANFVAAVTSEYDVTPQDAEATAVEFLNGCVDAGLLRREER